MLLLDAGADVNSKNVKRSITPVMIAGAVGHFKLLEVLANHHTADVNVQVWPINCSAKHIHVHLKLTEKHHCAIHRN